jgi:hypothetical protein
MQIKLLLICIYSALEMPNIIYSLFMTGLIVYDMIDMPQMCLACLNKIKNIWFFSLSFYLFFELDSGTVTKSIHIHSARICAVIAIAERRQIAA